jgi:hypothetical protein
VVDGEHDKSNFEQSGVNVGGSMTVHEQSMLNMGCPECKGDIELYETNPNGTGGKYRCKQCRRDTVWAVAKALSFAEIIAGRKAKIDLTPNESSSLGRKPRRLTALVGGFRRPVRKETWTKD